MTDSALVIPGAPVLVCLADVAPEQVLWLWPGRLARGKLAVLVGEPGVGKSFVSLDVAARISTGTPWPDGGAAPLGDVILLSAEDGPADTIRPRLDALGGDPARVTLLRAVHDADGERHFSLATDLLALESAMVTRGAALVIIDPLSAYLGGRDSYKDAEVRSLLAPVAALGEKRCAAVLGVMHTGKDSQRRAINRALGSIAFVAAARIVLAAGKDRDDEARRVLVPVKANLCAPAPALAYRIGGAPARVEWEPGTVEGVTADDVLGSGPPEDAEERKDADDLLREQLADGEQRAAEVLRAARENGIPERTLYRAKRRLGVKARHEGQPGKRGGAWYWFLPEDCRAPEDCHPKTANRGKWQPSSNAAREKPNRRTLLRRLPRHRKWQPSTARGGSLRQEWGEV